MDREALTHSRSKSAETYFFRQKLAALIVGGFVTGVLLSSLVYVAPLVAVFIGFMALAVLMAEKVWYKKINGETLLLATVLMSVAAGVLRYDIKDFHTLSPLLERQVGSEVVLEGQVVTEPERREESTRFVLLAEEEKILVSTDLYSLVRYGDRVQMEGELRRPEVIDDGAGRPFDYGAYLAKDNIYFTTSFAKTEVLSSGHGHLLRHRLLGIKERFIESVREILPEPQASLLSGLVVAGKSAMPRGVMEEFRRAGVVHIVVLSGYNITIIAEFIRKMFESLFMRVKLGHVAAGALGPRLAHVFAALGIVSFVIMTGAEATVVRASIMVLVVMAAKLSGREHSAGRALIFAAFLMIIHNPKILVFDPSFQLSFLATLALIYVVPLVEQYLGALPEKWGIKTVVSTTLGTQLVVLPLLVYSVGDVSLVSIFSNVLVLSLIPLTMLAGFLAALVTQASSVLALPLAYIANMFLSWILLMASFFGNLPFASMRVPFFPTWALVLAYLAMFILVWRLSSSLRRRTSSGS